LVPDFSRLAQRKALKHASAFVTPQFDHRPDVLAVVFIAMHRDAYLTFLIGALAKHTPGFPK
jgi:hypothetical protein